MCQNAVKIIIQGYLQGLIIQFEVYLIIWGPKLYLCKRICGLYFKYLVSLLISITYGKYYYSIYVMFQKINEVDNYILVLFEIRQLKYANLSNPGNYNKYKYCYIIFSVKYIHFDSILIIWNYVYNYSFLNDNLVLVIII